MPNRQPPAVAFPKRRLEALKLSGLSQREAADRLGVSETVVSNWVRARNVIRLEQLVSLARLTGRSTDWLLGGQDRTEPAAGHVEEKGEDYATLPVLAEVSAGVPRFAPSDQDPLRLAFRRKWLEHLVGPDISPRHVFLARVKGDSMHPTMRDKAVIRVERLHPRTEERSRKTVIESGKIYLVQEKDGDGLTVKTPGGGGVDPHGLRRQPGLPAVRGRPRGHTATPDRPRAGAAGRAQGGLMAKPKAMKFPDLTHEARFYFDRGGALGGEEGDRYPMLKRKIIADSGGQRPSSATGRSGVPAPECLGRRKPPATSDYRDSSREFAFRR